jgi:hypothetical protein
MILPNAEGSTTYTYTSGKNKHSYSLSNDNVKPTNDQLDRFFSPDEIKCVVNTAHLTLRDIYYINLFAKPIGKRLKLKSHKTTNPHFTGQYSRAIATHTAALISQNYDYTVLFNCAERDLHAGFKNPVIGGFNDGYERITTFCDLTHKQACLKSNVNFHYCTDTSECAFKRHVNSSRTATFLSDEIYYDNFFEKYASSLKMGDVLLYTYHHTTAAGDIKMFGHPIGKVTEKQIIDKHKRTLTFWNYTWAEPYKAACWSHPNLDHHTDIPYDQTVVSTKDGLNYILRTETITFTGTGYYGLFSLRTLDSKVRILSNPIQEPTFSTCMVDDISELTQTEDRIEDERLKVCYFGEQEEESRVCIIGDYVCLTDKRHNKSKEIDSSTFRVVCNTILNKLSQKDITITDIVNEVLSLRLNNTIALIDEQIIQRLIKLCMTMRIKLMLTTFIDREHFSRASAIIQGDIKLTNFDHYSLHDYTFNGMHTAYVRNRRTIYTYDPLAEDVWSTLMPHSECKCGMFGNPCDTCQHAQNGFYPYLQSPANHAFWNSIACFGSPKVWKPYSIIDKITNQIFGETNLAALRPNNTGLWFTLFATRQTKVAINTNPVGSLNWTLAILTGGNGHTQSTIDQINIMRRYLRTNTTKEVKVNDQSDLNSIRSKLWIHQDDQLPVQLNDSMIIMHYAADDIELGSKYLAKHPKEMFAALRNNLCGRFEIKMDNTYKQDFSPEALSGLSTVCGHYFYKYVDDEQFGELGLKCHNAHIDGFTRTIVTIEFNKIQRLIRVIKSYKRDATIELSVSTHLNREYYSIHLVDDLWHPENPAVTKKEPRLMQIEDLTLEQLKTRMVIGTSVATIMKAKRPHPLASELKTTIKTALTTNSKMQPKQLKYLKLIDSLDNVNKIDAVCDYLQPYGRSTKDDTKSGPGAGCVHCFDPTKACPCVVYQNTTPNKVTALKRQLSDVAYNESVALENANRAIKYFDSQNIQLLEEDIIHLDEYINQLQPGKRNAIYRELKDIGIMMKHHTSLHREQAETLTHVYLNNRPMQIRAFTYKLMVKTEKQPLTGLYLDRRGRLCGKPPKIRAISQPNAIRKIMFGWIAKTLADNLNGGLKGYCDGKNADYYNETIERMDAAGLTNTVSADFSGYDLTVTKEIKSIDKHILENHLLPRLKKKDYRYKIVRHLIDNYDTSWIKLDGSYKNNPAIKVIGKVFSGDVFTTVFNTARNSLLYGSLLPNDTYFLIKGDDSIFFTKQPIKAINSLAPLLQSGTNFKIEYKVGELLDFDFCSMTCVTDTQGKYRVLRNQEAFMNKHHLSTKQDCWATATPVGDRTTGLLSMVANLQVDRPLIEILKPELMPLINLLKVDREKLDKDDAMRHQTHVINTEFKLRQNTFPKYIPMINYIQFINHPSLASWFKIRIKILDTNKLWIEQTRKLITKEKIKEEGHVNHGEPSYVLTSSKF